MMTGFKHIRTKLILMALGIICGFAIATLSYFKTIEPISAIQGERLILTALSSKLKNLQVEVNRLMTAGVSAEQPRYTQAVADYGAAFADLDTIRVIPALNKDLAAAIGVIKDVNALSADGLATVKESYDRIVADMSANNASMEAAPLNFNELLGIDSEGTAGKMIKLMMFKKKVDSLDYVLGIGENTITEQYAIIDREIARVERKAASTALGVTIFIVFLTMLAAWLVSRAISRPIVKIERTISILKTGDLTPRMDIASGDELGLLARNLNSLLDVIADFLGNIQKASSENQRIKIQMTKAVNETASSSVEIEANTKSIKIQMEKVDSMADSATGSVESMNKSFGGFLERLESRNDKVDDTVSGVTQMLSSIESIVRITDKDQLAAQSLVEESERGKKVFEEAFDRIAEINNSIDSIQQMATVIRGVAAQTNLLAMNAAIEAAHAGDVGQGFAVVADEIRKLAETSNRSSKEISQTIKDVTHRIRDAADSRGTTAAAFDAIRARIQTVSQSTTEIFSNISEMQVGGTQILQAMAELKKQSGELTSESHQFEESAKQVRETIEQLSRVAGEVVTNIDEITTGLDLIGKSVRIISEHANKVEEVGNAMDENIRKFKTS